MCEHELKMNLYAMCDVCSKDAFLYVHSMWKYSFRFSWVLFLFVIDFVEVCVCVYVCC